MSATTPPAVFDSGTKVNLQIPCEVEKWCSTLQCTKQQLEQAANAVGLCPNAITVYLQNHPNPPFPEVHQFIYNEFIG